MAKRLYRTRRLKDEEVAVDKIVRDEFKERPSRAQLLTSGDYVGPMTIEEDLLWRAGRTSTPLSKQLQAAIKACNKSINAIAEESSVSQPIIQRFMSGECGITLETVDRLAEYLGLTPWPDARNAAKK